jgi:hypothetical protein
MQKPQTASVTAFDPAVVQTVTTAYEGALHEISAGCGYLPPRECRRAIASRMLMEARAGECDPDRLKIWGLAAVEDFEAIPLALAFGALLRHAAATAARSDEG